MSQQSSDESPKSSPFTKIFGILVVIVILAIVVVQLTTSPDEPSTANEPAKMAKTETETADKEAAEPVASEPETKDQESVVAHEPMESSSSSPANTEQDKKEIEQFIEDWKVAWQKSPGANGDLDAYFAFYADNFTSGKLDKAKWQESKKIRNQGKSWIEVWTSDHKITAQDDGSYRVTFKQEYSSSNYSDKGTKELIIVKNDAGWQIISERSL